MKILCKTHVDGKSEKSTPARMYPIIDTLDSLTRVHPQSPEGDCQSPFYDE
jgi:hypothetical protein